MVLLNSSTISFQLSKYVSEVEHETGRDVKIRPYDDAELHDEHRASLEIGPSISNVEIRYRPLIEESNPAFEKLIAHELTHALMVYKEGFHLPAADPSVATYSVQTAAEVVDLVDDVIVDARIHRLGFFPSDLDHLGSFVRNLEILNLARSREQIDPFEEDATRAEIMFVSHYVYAWALPRCVQLAQEQVALFDAFTHRFPRVLSAEYAKAEVITKSFEVNDIFTVSGRTKVVIGAMSLWPVEEGIYLAALSDA